MNYDLFFLKMFFAVFCVDVDCENRKQAQTTYRKPHCKVTKLKSKFYLFLG